MYCFGPFSVDPARRVLTRHDQGIPVTARAFDVLLALVERAGQTVGKDELLQIVWTDTVVEEANLSQHIFTIRKVLGQTDAEPYIATVPRRGYQFVAPVTVRDQGKSRPAIEMRAIDRSPLRLEIPIAHGMSFVVGATPLVALSPDGSRLVYVAHDGTTTRLFLRQLDSFDAVSMDGTDGAANPFFSPDGQWIGFESRRRLQRIPVDGGPPLTVCEVADLRGATWSKDGEIIFSPGPTTGLWRVAAAGGIASPLTTLDFDGGERTHRWPHALADGSAVVFTVGRSGATSFDEASLAVVSMHHAGHRLVLQHATDGRCVDDSRLVWARGAAIFAAEFDATSGRVTSAPRMVQRGVSTSATGVAHFTCSANGVMVHVPGEAQTLRRVLITVNRRGVETGRHTTGDSLEEPRWARDGAAAIVSLRHRSSDLWTYDFARGALGRLTFDGENFAGIWGPDAGTITFSASHGGPSDLYLLRPDRSAPPELLVSSEFDKVAGAWSADGTTLVFTEYHPDTGADLWLIDRASERARPFVGTRFNEYAPVFSPDGRHVAYVTDESGRPEVVVVNFADAAGKRQLSTDGGTEPVWSRGGDELFYRSGNRMMRVDLKSGVANAGIPTTLFEGEYVPGTVTLANYDVSPDASEFLMVRADITPPPSSLRVTLGSLGG